MVETPAVRASFPLEILEHLDLALFAVDVTGNIVHANTRGRRLAGNTKGMVRRFSRDLAAELMIERLFTQGDVSPIENRKIAIGSCTYNVHAFFQGGLLYLVLTDITDLKVMASDMSKHITLSTCLAYALNYFNCGIIITDTFKNILFMNKTMKGILCEYGMDCDEASLQEIEDIFLQNDNSHSNNGMFSNDIGNKNTDSRITIEKYELFAQKTKLKGFLLCFYIKDSLQQGSLGGGGSGNRNAAGGKGMPLPLRIKNDQEGRQVERQTAINEFVGQSQPILHIKEVVKKVAPYVSTVLLQSESGTGKELLARALHELSDRAGNPFVKINCASLPESLMEAEVFGYDSGAFTGAKKSGNPGLFERAHTGTIFLDEIGEMSLTLQAKLLRIIQEREVQRIGGQDAKQLDFRIVCATNKNLLHLVEQGLFRSDLLFRLNVILINIPPLRERKEDIKSLIIHYIHKYSVLFKKNVQGISREVYYIFMNYSWPGNVRELSNVLEYSFNIIDSKLIEVEHLPKYIIDYNMKHVSSHNDNNFAHNVSKYSANLLLEMLRKHEGNKMAAAAALGISRSTLYRILRRSSDV